MLNTAIPPSGSGDPTLNSGFTGPWGGELLIRAGDALSARHPRCTVGSLDVTYNAAIAALSEKRVDLPVAETPVEGLDGVLGPVLPSKPRRWWFPPTTRRRDDGR